MGSEIFAMTPIEAAIWHMGVMAQSYVSAEVFGSNVFNGMVILCMMIMMLRGFFKIGEGAAIDGVAWQLVSYLLITGLGLVFLRTLNTRPFTTTDASGRSWSENRQVTLAPEYEGLKRSTDGLYWYTLLHKGGVEIANTLTAAVSGVFHDKIYPKSSNMVFKMLVSTANVALDDPHVMESMEILVAKCSDTIDGKVLGKDDSMKSLFDLTDPECEAKYQNLQTALRVWVQKKYPSYLEKFESLPDSETPEKINGIKNRNTLENKMISSAIVNYAKSKGGHKDGINTNSGALVLNDKSERFWFNVQRVVAGGASAATIANLFTKEDTEATITKNEAGIIYNNLLNLMPAIRGYIKAFLALSFLLCAAALTFGQVKPMIWWLSALGMESLYMPLSALNYELCVTFMMNSNVLSGFGELRFDPMVLAGAAIIDDQLVRVQTAYFIVQVVILSMFGFGVIRSGFAVRQMSFGQGSAFMSVARNLSHNRLVNMVGRGAAKGLSQGAGRTGK